MYGSTSSSASYAQVHTNTTSSTIKSTLDTWYTNNIKNTSFESSVSDTEFCNDRSVSSGSGTGSSTTEYGPYNRNKNNKNPTLTCPQKNDRFTVSDTNIGNGALTYPIGLITIDEGAMRGGVWGSGSDVDYWTMSPGNMLSTGLNAYAYVGYITNTRMGSNVVYNTDAKIIPVINIKSEKVITMTGTGTSSDPFVVH